MAFEHLEVVDSPLDDVFAWHTRPGAVTRLTPPWLPVRVAREAGSLRDGTAVLALPGGLEWVAQHQPEGYDPPYGFVDVLATPALRRLLGWRHVHEFEEADGGGRTRVVDRVHTRVPARWLEPMFTYRARQLAGDLAAHRRAARLRAEPLCVAVSGSSGLIGSALCALLTSGGHRVVRLVRGPAEGPGERHWDLEAPGESLLEGVDAVVHLAGEPIAGRFTPGHKAALRHSRIGPTHRLAEVMGDRTFVVASAVGFYGPGRGDEELTEDSSRGDGFLADLVADWEAAAAPARDSGARVVHVRTGIVQSPRGGALRLLRPLFEVGLGGRLGDGRPWMSWIGIDDLVDVYLHCLVDAGVSGPINAVAPDPVRNLDYTRTLARVLRRWAVAPVPVLGPRILFGSEGVEEFVMASQRVRPARLETVGHPFRHPDLESALRHVLGKES